MEVPQFNQSIRTPLQAERLEAARQIMQGEAAAITGVAEALDDQFLNVVDVLTCCKGQVVLSGMGKAGLIAQKLSATFASTGTRSIFLHPTEAVHGDLGRVNSADVLLLLSYSGETDELNRLLPTLRSMASKLVAITSSRSSTLGRAVDYVLALGALREVCPLGLAPSTSTTAMLALGDALALSVSHLRGFTREQFARNHPAGSLGRKLAPVEEVMRPLATCRVANSSTSLCEVLVKVSRPGRRSGAVMLVDDHQRLVGIFTDSDLARLLEQRRHSQLDAPIAEVMTTRFRTVSAGSLLSEAIDLLAEFKISELPVIDSTGQPMGMIDITDVIGLVTQAEQLKMNAAPLLIPPLSIPPLSIGSEPTLADDGSLVSIPLSSHVSS